MLNRAIPSHRRAGLSLIELLVSLALLALIAAGLAGAFGVGTQVYDRARALNQHQEELAARRQLRSALAQALPLYRITPFPNSFVGAPDRLQFVTLKETPYAPDASALKVEVLWASNTLSMLVEAIDDRGTVLASWDHTLARDVRNVTFQYLDDSGDVPDWAPVWTGTPELPDLIQIVGEGGAPRWVDFVVAPRL
ncbi:prepilin-type N-terminal cleavage/methylation domain-containing protein [Tateyamaria sp. SN3-11]|uniref:prepilin-type N-terminal cleavage/methylation domain-containing protein n=1 Tax=Tateyamaria sp. SN3-11 TaxID=3092147 RepID=UPI0039ED43A1